VPGKQDFRRPQHIFGQHCLPTFLRSSWIQVAHATFAGLKKDWQHCLAHQRAKRARCKAMAATCSRHNWWASKKTIAQSARVL
jgi:hypothetical protein